MNRLSDILKGLNKNQKEAVLNIDGPMMVIAGPGTGKTHVLSARIARILSVTDTSPYSILALTFTDSAAKNMRERIVSMIGKEGYYVEISTFHSFCSNVIQTYPEYFPIDRRSTPLSDLERISIFEGIIERLRIKALKPINSPQFYIKDIISTISQLKKENIMPDDFQKILNKEFDGIESSMPPSKKRIFLNKKEKNEELAIIYNEYESELRKNRKYDFDDMISLVVEAFKKNDTLLRDYQEKLHYFLIDEYQDTNTSQNIVVNLLASYWGDTANICVVGDPHQSIYRFQGASIENTLDFVKKYPRAKIVTLTTGYRCPQNIYDASHQLIVNNTLTTDTEKPETFFASINDKLISKNPKKFPISLNSYPSQIVEIITIAEKIRKLIEKGVNPAEIAVLYRNNYDALEVKEIFDKWDIFYEIDGGENILVTEHISQLITLFKLIYNIQSSFQDGDLFKVMSYDWIEIDKLLIMKAARAASKAKSSLYDLIQKGYETFKQYDVGPQVSHIEFHQLEAFINKLNMWAIIDKQVIFTEFFETLIKESGYLEWILQKDIRTEMLIGLNALFREVKSMVNSNHELKLSEFVDRIETMKDHGISIVAEDINIKKGAVHLSTVHRAKGQEWDHVFMIHCTDGKWGNSQKRDLISLPSGILPNTDISKKEKNEDERRLFYVALTRTKKNLCISYPETVITEGRSKSIFPSMFLQEIDGLNRNENDFVPEKSIVDSYLEKLIGTAHKKVVPAEEKEYFSYLIKNFKLSITALNTYLKDKDEFIENVLLKVPRAKPEPMVFGTAIHSALEKMYAWKMNKEEVTLIKILNVFETTLKNELILTSDIERRLEKGKEVLTNYFETYRDEKVETIYVERFFGFGFSRTVLNDIPLTGRIDRIDWLDKKTNMVRVIDYKTGSARSMNEIEGKTASSNLSKEEMELPEEIRGPYKRQLVFYKLLTELDKSFNPKMEEGIFDFVEPNKQTGKLVRRKFIITDGDVSLLKKLIISTMKDIRALAFLEDYSTKSLSFRARVG